MKMRKFTIAGGNPTLLIWGCPTDKRIKIANQYLDEVEQVGFVDIRNAMPQLTMMGGELCVNATLALASQLGPSGRIRTSGLSNVVEYANANERTIVSLTLPYRCEGNTVLLPGIGFIVTNSSLPTAKSGMRTLADKYYLPAFGQITVKDRQIEPYVYVRATDSLIKETACGSGSIATAIILNRSEIIQPTGQTIRVERDGGKFHISTHVEHVS